MKIPASQIFSSLCRRYKTLSTSGPRELSLITVLTLAACAPEGISRQLYAPHDVGENASQEERKTGPDDSDQQTAGTIDNIDQSSLRNINLTEQDREINDQILQRQTDRISADVDAADFKVTGLRVGLEEKLLNRLPVVVFFPVPLADFYQLMRCEIHADIRGPFASLEDVEILSVNPDDEARAQKENRFWTVAETHSGCVMLTEALVRTVYYDENLPDGDYKYLARACKFDTSQEARCSVVVSQSTGLTNYKNESSAWNTFILEEVAQKERTIEDLTLRLAFLSQQFATSIVGCEQENNRRALSLQKKTLLSEIIGLGAQIGGHLILNDFSTPLEAASSVWTNRADLVAGGKPLMTLLKDLFVTEDDLQLSCTEAESFAREAQIVLQEIEVLKQVVNGLSGTSSEGGQL